MLLLVAYGQRDPNAYYLTQHIQQSFGKGIADSMTYKDVFTWANTTLLNKVYGQPPGTYIVYKVYVPFDQMCLEFLMYFRHYVRLHHRWKLEACRQCSTPAGTSAQELLQDPQFYEPLHS